MCDLWKGLNMRLIRFYSTAEVEVLAFMPFSVENLVEMSGMEREHQT